MRGRDKGEKSQVGRPLVSLVVHTRQASGGLSVIQPC